MAHISGRITEIMSRVDYDTRTYDIFVLRAPPGVNPRSTISEGDKVGNNLHVQWRGGGIILAPHEQLLKIATRSRDASVFLVDHQMRITPVLPGGNFVFDTWGEMSNRRDLLDNGYRAAGTTRIEYNHHLGYRGIVVPRESDWVRRTYRRTLARVLVRSRRRNAKNFDTLFDSEGDSSSMAYIVNSSIILVRPRHLFLALQIGHGSIPNVIWKALIFVSGLRSQNARHLGRRGH